MIFKLFKFSVYKIMLFDGLQDVIQAFQLHSFELRHNLPYSAGQFKVAMGFLQSTGIPPLRLLHVYLFIVKISLEECRHSVHPEHDEVQLRGQR